MGKLLELVRSARASYKLTKGQCISCHTILRDDAADNCCSEECRVEAFLDTFV